MEIALKINPLNIAGFSKTFFMRLAQKNKPRLQYIAGVSWPRSGHHLVKRILRRYFGKKFRYCEFYTYENCCKTFPCARAGKIHFSKNHDHDFSVPQKNDVKYFIQFRDFPHSVVSNFELHVKRGAGPDTALEFRIFASTEWAEYRKFVEKWVTSEFAKTHLVVDYRELTEDPEGAMHKIIKLFAPTAGIKHKKLNKIINSINSVSSDSAGEITTGKGVKSTRVLEDFRFYDPQLFITLKRLNLSRQDVVDAFKQVLGREPDETHMLELQCSTSSAELTIQLRDQLN